MKRTTLNVMVKYLIGLSLAVIAVSNCFNVLSNSSFIVAPPSSEESRTEAARPQPNSVTPRQSVGDKLGGASSLFMNSSLNPANRRGTTPLAGLRPAGMLSPFAAMLTATKTDNRPSIDPASANPGDTIMYTIEITNSGAMDATNVNFMDTIDANTTLVVGSVAASPIAVDDTSTSPNYHTIGNVNIVIPAAQGVMANDLNPNGPTSQLSVTKVNATNIPPLGSATASTTNGQVTLSSDGGFNYSPNPGFEGTDTFTYTLDNTTGKTDTATVTITVSGMIWFVDASASPVGANGTLQHPFNCLVGVGCFDPTAADDPGDNIFLYSGNYTGGLTLLNNQRIIGQGATQTILAITGLSAPSGSSSPNPFPSTGGANPVITTTGADAITLGMNNGLHGFTVGNTTAAGDDIFGNAFGNLTVKNVTLNGNGEALNLGNGTVVTGSTFDTVESTGGSATQGIHLSLVGGGFTITTTNIVDTTGNGIDVQNSPAGTAFNFGATTVNKGTTAGTGVNLAFNSGTFSFSSLAVTTSNGTGVAATTSGTVNVSGGSIAATGGPALLVNPTAIGMTFSTVSSTNSTTTGISLTSASGSLTIGTTTITNPTGIGIGVNTSSATLDFGTTSSTGSGGTGISLTTNTGTIQFGPLTITPDAGQKGLVATENTNTITIPSGTITTSNNTAVEITKVSGTTPLVVSLTSVSANGGSNGILLSNTNGSFAVVGTGTTDGTGGTIQNISVRGASFSGASNITLKNMNLINASTTDGAVATDSNTASLNAAIYLSSVATVILDNINISGTNQEGIIGVTVSNLTLNNSTIANAGTSGASSEEGALKMRELTGTVTMNNDDFSFSAGPTIEIENTTGNLILKLNNTTMRDTQASSSGQGGLQVVTTGTTSVHPSAIVDVVSCSFLNLRSHGVNVQSVGTTDTGSASSDVDISASTFDPGTGTMIGIDLDADDASTLVFNVLNNTKVYARNGPAINVFGDVSATINGRINNNPDVKVLNNVGSNVGSGIRANLNKNATAKLEIKTNTVNVASDDAGIDLSGIGKVTANPGGATDTLDATVTGNNVTIGATSTYGIIILSATNAGDTNAVCVNVATNAITRNPASIASFRARVPSVNGFFRMQGFVTNPEATWNANGNTPMSVAGSEVSFGGSGTFGSCTTDLPTNGVLDADSISNPDAQIASVPHGDVTSDGSAGSIGKKEDILSAFGGEGHTSDNARPLLPPQMQWMVQAAIQRWRNTGISVEDLARLEGVTFELADLPNGQIAAIEGTRVKIDEIGAGYGWFFDETPQDDSEFLVPVPGRELQTTQYSAADGKMDLLTVIMRELGQVYLQGKDRIPNRERKNLQPLMENILAPGVRRLPLDQWKVTLSTSRTSPATGQSVDSKAASASASQPKIDSASRPNADSAATFPTSLRDLKSTVFNPTADVMPGSYEGSAKRMSYAPGARPVAAARPMFADMVSKALGTIPPGEKVVIMFSVTINNPVTPGTTQVCNQGTVTADGPISIMTNDPDTVAADDPTCTPLNVADLSVTKTDSPDPVSAGANITYTVTVTNGGPAVANSVTLNDAIPANTTFVSTTTPAGWSRDDTTAVGATGTLMFSKATMANAETAVFTIIVKVNSGTANGTTITNNAVAATTSPDPTGNNTGTATTTVQASADLSVTKTDSPDPVSAGSNITYTITLTNNGPSDAQTVTLNDAVPTNTTFVSVTTPAGWTRTDSVPLGGTGTISFTKPTVVTTETALFTLIVNVNPSAPDASIITNSATAGSGTTDPVPANNTGTAMTTVVAMVDLAVTKSDSPDPVLAGNNITYTISFVNNGPAAASNVTVTDATPLNTTFVSMSTGAAGWTLTNPGVGNTGNVVFSKASVPNGETATFTIVVKVNANTASGSTIMNSVTAATTSTDSNNLNNTATADTTVNTQADLSVTKTDTPDPVGAGANITYTITVTNNGPSDAQAVSLTDAVPANTTFVSETQTTGPAFTCTNPSAGGTGTTSCTITTLAAGATATFEIVVKVDPSFGGASITNTADVATTTTDPTPGNNSSTAMTAVNVSADLVVLKTDSPDPVNAGANITYTINFSNAGPSDAQMVTVTDAVPANTTFVSAAVTTGLGWGTTTPPVGGTGNVVFSKPTVVAGETAVFTIVVKVNADTASGSTITNNAVASSPSDSNVGNNTGTATTTVATSADLSVTKSDLPDPAFSGGNITYTINFSNLGPSDAQTVTVTDAVPANTTFVSAVVTTGTGWLVTAPAVGGTGNVVFSKGTVAGGETAVFTIVVKVDASTATGTIITNSATAASATTDPDNSNNTGTTTTTIASQADLSVTKTDSPDPVTAGTNLTYTISFSNNGPGSSNTVTVTDATPANTTFVSATAPAGWTTTTPAVGGTGNVVFSKVTVAASETAVFTMVVNVNANAASGSTITNSAVTASATADPDNSNDTGTATTTVATSADLSVTKTDSPDPVTAGNNLTYTISFSNLGPSDAQGVTVTDNILAGTTFQSAMVTTGSGWTVTAPPVGGTGNVVFSKATVAAGETATFVVVVKVPSNTTAGTIINNTAVAAATTTDPVSGNNSSSTTTTVNVQADLSVTKSDSPDPVTAGSNLTYTIDFSNLGPSDAQTVTVTDAVPANTTFVSAVQSVGGGWSVTSPAVGGTGNVVFSKTTSPAGEMASFTMVVNVNPGTANGTIITNSATVATATTDPVGGNNTGTTTTTVAVQADLAVTKTDSPDPVLSGNNITYTVNFVNNGPSVAQNVTVTDAVPANTTFVSATAPAGWSSSTPAPGGTGNVIFSRTPVASGETAMFTIVVKVNSSAVSGTITNSATAASTTPDGTPGNNTGTTMTGINTSVDLAVTKTDSPDPVTAGQNLTYTINFINNGPSDAQTVSITDPVPANTTFVSATAPAGWTTTTPPVGGTGNITFTKPTTVGGETAMFTIVVNVNAGTASGTTITNSAVAASSTTDANPSSNTATTMTTVQTIVDLMVTKTDSPDPVNAGNNLTYTINFTNPGPSNAQTVTVTDAVPANATFVSATAPAGWTLTTPPVGGTGNVVFSKGTVAAGETAVFTMVVKVNANTPNGTTITNSATALSSTTESSGGSNTGTATTTVQTSADIVVTKTESSDPVVAGSNLTYTINFTNNGPSDAQSVTVTDAVPANTTFVSASVTTGIGWTITAPPAGGTGNVVFSKPTAAAGETAVFRVIVKVNSNTPSGTTITNNAVGASTTSDPSPGNSTGTASTAVNLQADLAVTKSDSPDPVVASQNLTYTINFVNNGPSNASTVTVSDTLPANTTFVSATAPAGWTSATPAPGGTGTVTFSKPTVVSGETAVFTIVVNVNLSTPNNTVLTNSATAASPTPDGTPGNNTGTTTTLVVAQADLAVTKTDSPDPVCVNGNITYTITFTNNGPGPGINTTVTDGTPANTTFVSAAVISGAGWGTTMPGVGATGNVVFSKASTASGETATFQVVVKVNAGTVHHTVISNSATAASSIPDPNMGNNTGTATTTVDPIPPTFTNGCPGPISTAGQASCPFATAGTVSFATPAVSDNCSATVACVPPSGSMFPTGTTTVTCTATDTAGNTATCSFPVTVFSLCVQDNSNPGNVVLIDTTTGAYRFCCNGVVVASGIGTRNARGCTLSISDNSNGNTVQVSLDTAVMRGTASFKQGGNVVCTIQDSNLANNTCVCN